MLNYMNNGGYLRKLYFAVEDAIADGHPYKITSFTQRSMYAGGERRDIGELEVRSSGLFGRSIIDIYTDEGAWYDEGRPRKKDAEFLSEIEKKIYR